MAPLYAAFKSLLPALSRPAAKLAAVGGGGKTGLLFALAAGRADEGGKILITTTTHMWDPRGEKDRRFDEVVLEPSLSSGPAEGLAPSAEPCGGASLRLAPPEQGGPWIRVVASGLREDRGRLVGVDPGWIGPMAEGWDLVLVEADGSKELPIKAPAAHEPVLPPCADIVIGVVGLDALGKPMNSATVHRPELFGPLVACPPEGAIGLDHLRALAAAPRGLFKGSPRGASRLLVLNKADLISREERARLAASLAASPISSVDAVLLASVREGWAEAL